MIILDEQSYNICSDVYIYNYVIEYQLVISYYYIVKVLPI
mgnify:CR=1 FL=1